MKRRILLYNHAGCENHGCEAIVRTTSELFHSAGFQTVLASGQASFDRSLGLPYVDKIISPEISPYSIDRVINSVGFRLGMPREQEVARKFAPVIREGRKCGLCLSVGGDTYCYGRQEHMRVINKKLKQQGVPLVLWGCSLDPELLSVELTDELKEYDLIVARESVTAEAMRACGLTVVQKCDPAFAMKGLQSDSSEKLIKKQTVGLNISPLVLDHIGDRETGLRYFLELMNHILNDTPYSIALFSHVTWGHDNDAAVNKRLADHFSGNPRVFSLPDSMTAEEIKGCIRQMKLVVTARTHASIAAYSSFVPVLVIGYSVKARGIARDIYGTEDGHVIDAHQLKDSEALITRFDALNLRAEDERRFLETRIPDYCADRENAVQKVIGLIR